MIAFKYKGFKFCTVNNINTLIDSFRLRHDVYVKRCGFEQFHEFSNPHEIDEYDKNSIHLVCLNDKNKVVGTTRLIKFSYKTFLPILKECGELDLTFLIDDISNLYEISRFAIDENYTYTATGNGHVTLGLFVLMSFVQEKYRINDGLMLIDKSLDKFLNYIKLSKIQVGDYIDFRGIRTPYYINMNAASKHVRSLFT